MMPLLMTEQESSSGQINATVFCFEKMKEPTDC